MRFQRLTDSVGINGSPAISPDPDWSSLIYFTKGTTAGDMGTLWEISALGGKPRPIASALGGGDISHDSECRRRTAWSPRGDQIAFLMSRETMIARRIAWAPDGQSLYAAVEESTADVISFEGLLY